MIRLYAVEFVLPVVLVLIGILFLKHHGKLYHLYTLMAKEVYNSLTLVSL